MWLSVLKLCMLVVSCVLITACANQKLFNDGKLLLEKGKQSEGFKLLKQAAEENARDPEIKNYYYRQKELWVNKTLKAADTERVNENWKVAEAKYKDILAVEEDNVRALNGLEALALGKSNADLYSKAEDSYEKEDFDSAREKLNQILKTNSTHNRAKTLLAKIQHHSQGEASKHSVVKSKFKKPISLELRDAPVKTVFQLLSKSAGVNFILDKDIRNDALVSVFVKNTTIDEALNNILATAQLSKKILNENSVLIYPNARKGEYEELVAKTFYLRNADPKKVFELIKTVIGTKEVFVDDSLKILIMRDTAQAIQTAEKLIQAYDLNDPEVLLEVEVLEVSSDRLSEIGLRFPSQITAGVVGAAGVPGGLTLNEAKNFNSGLARLTITDPALILNLRGTEGSSNTLASPHIRVRNHKKAKVHIGDRVPVITNTATATGFLSESITYLDVGLKLDVEPTILVDDNVAIDVSLEVSNIINEVISKSGSLSYRIGTRNASTSLQLKNGETQILAGLISSEERSSAERVPGLASLPIIGRLFSSKRDTRAKTEIVLLITPRIIRNIAAPDASYTDFSLGTETGNSPAGMSSSTQRVNSTQQPGNAQQTSSEPQVIQSLGQETMSPNQNLPSPDNPNGQPVGESLQPTPLDIPPPPPLPNLPVPEVQAQ